MPYVNIKLAGSVTREQKAQIAKEFTETLERVAHKPAAYTYITFEEVNYEDWAIAGSLLADA
jgi:4-oxalocrotonate tautomerase